MNQEEGEGSGQNEIKKDENESEVNVDDDDDLFGDKENENSPTEKNENNTNEEKKPEEKDNLLDSLFGSDSEKEEEKKAPESNENENETEAPFYGQEEEEEEKIEKEPGPPEELEYYHLPKLAKDAKLYYVRLPNTLSLEPRPFNPATYEEMKTSEQVDEEGKRAFINPETAIRWRYVTDENGEMKKESNARFVRWSDGSLQLMVGNETYDVVQQEISQDHPNFLFVRQHQFIKCQGKLNHKLIVRPTNLASSKAHQRLTASVVQRHKREKKIKIVVTEADPELDKQKKEQAEDQKIKASMRLEGARNRKKNKYDELTPEYLEEGMEGSEDEGIEEDDRTSKRKKRRMSEEEAERRLSKAKEPSNRYKKSKNSYSDEEEGSDY